MTKIVLITGATSGFGRAIAIKFGENGYRLIITGRRRDRLNHLSRELREKHHTEVLQLCFDVRNVNEVEEAIKTLPEEWKAIDILVNNSGLAAGMSLIHEGLIDDWERMIDTNVKGLLYMTRFIAPMMVERKQGHIINIGSIAGKEVYPGGNVYCASKFAVDAITRGARIDLVAHNIKVTQIAPGSAETEFALVRFHGDAEKAAGIYKGYIPLRPEDIADVVYYCATLPAHVNINDMVVTCTAQASATNFNKK
jgi:3-hydroxy acid dehydrogenase/malonic semialdehyde reductase